MARRKASESLVKNFLVLVPTDGCGYQLSALELVPKSSDKVARGSRDIGLATRQEIRTRLAKEVFQAARDEPGGDYG